MPLDHTDLREMKKRADVEGLLNILETGDVKECREAITILGELKNKKAIRPLMGMLETDDVLVRANAAWALGEIGDIKAVLPLIGLLNDPTENVRIHAAWSLGRIGDKRAIPGLKNAMKNGSTDLRKHAKEAISKIESNGKNEGAYVEKNEITFSESIDIPLVTLNVPQEIFECDYKYMVESQKENGDARISKDVLMKDKFSRDNTRRIVLGLKNEFDGLVSVDVVLRYFDGDVKRMSSVWLQMSSTGEIRKRPTIRSSNFESVPDDLDIDDDLGMVKRRHEIVRKGTKIARKSRRVEYDEDVREDPQVYDMDSLDEDEDRQEKAKKNEISRFNIENHPLNETRRQPVEPLRSETITTRSTELDRMNETPRQPPLRSEITKRPIEPDQVKETPRQPVEPLRTETITKPIEPDRMNDTPRQPVEPLRSETTSRPTERDRMKETVPEKPEIRTKHIDEEIERLKKEKVKPKEAQLKSAPEIKPKKQPEDKIANVDSAVKLLSHIGMSGMTNAASTVTQLSGQEAESLQSQLRTLPVEQLKDEIINLGESIVLVGVKLHGKGQTGDVNGEMQVYISKENALSVANELLCNPPDAAVKELTEDIISTLKETANIFGGQYISAISEYIEVPLLLKAPSFKTGTSLQIAESVVKDIKGKIEFVLATDLALGTNKTGRLIMLLDPASFDTIIKKLF